MSGLLTALAAQLRTQHPDGNGYVSRHTRRIHLSVHKTHVQRAGVALLELERAAVAAGHEVVEHAGRLVISADDLFFRFTLRERRERRKATAAEAARPFAREFVDEPTGTLVLALMESNTESTHAQKFAFDSAASAKTAARQAVRAVPKLAARAHEANRALEARRDAIDVEEQSRRATELAAQRTREEQAALTDQRERAVTTLLAEARALREAAAVREYIRAVEQAAGEVEASSLLAGWLRWAEEVAAAMDHASARAREPLR